jgi:hypothetical protein
MLPPTWPVAPRIAYADMVGSPELFAVSGKDVPVSAEP